MPLSTWNKEVFSAPRIWFSDDVSKKIPSSVFQWIYCQQSQNKEYIETTLHFFPMREIFHFTFLHVVAQPFLWIILIFYLHYLVLSRKLLAQRLSYFWG